MGQPDRMDPPAIVLAVALGASLGAAFVGGPARAADREPIAFEHATLDGPPARYDRLETMGTTDTEREALASLGLPSAGPRDAILYCARGANARFLRVGETFVALNRAAMLPGAIVRFDRGRALAAVVPLPVTPLADEEPLLEGFARALDKVC